MNEGKPLTIEFAYVYVLYYYNPYSVDRWHQFDPVVYSSLEGAQTVITNRSEQKTLQEINPGTRWRAGWYWIDRLAICDVYDHGLEYETSDGNGKRRQGTLPLKFD